MCTYLTQTAEVAGVAERGEGWFDVAKVVVYFDHPQEAPVDHALCIDFRGGAVSERVAVELDRAGARRLAEAILSTLDAAPVL